jgi:CHAT domain-containing protein
MPIVPSPIRTAVGSRDSVRRFACAVSILLIVGACASPSARYQQLFDSATDRLWRGDLTQALAAAEDGTQRSASDPTSLWACRFRLLKAEVLLVMRQPRDVPRLLAAPIPDGSQYAAVRAKRRFLDGQLALVTGKLDDAASALQAAAALADQASAADIWLDAEAMRGQALLRRGQWREGEAVLSAAADRADRAGDRYHESVALVNQGMGHLVRGQYDAALPLFERVVAFDGLKGRMVHTAALGNAGICYYRLGEFTRAIDLQRRAVDAYEASGRPDPLLEEALGALGTTYLVKGEPAHAIEYLQRAFDAATRGHRIESAARWADNIAASLITLGRWDEAAAMNSEARRLTQSAGSRTFAYNTVNAAEIALGRGQRDQAERLFSDGLKDGGAIPVVQWEAYAGLGRVERARGRATAAGQQFAAALNVIERSQSGLQKTEYKLPFLTSTIQFYAEYIDLLVEQHQYDAALAIADSSRARVLAERHGVAAPERSTAAMFKRTAADLGGTLLFYWTGSRQSYAWIITPTSIRFVPLAIAATEIERLVRGYQQSIVESLGNPIAAGSPVGDELYARLIAPLGDLGSGRIVIVPDGALHMLNFETLPVGGERRHYWIEDVEVAVAPSLAALSATAPAPGRHDGVLLVGDALQADPEFPRLQYASMEMDAVARAFPGRTAIYRRDRATPASYRAAHPDRYDIVHFAAHAAANVDSPLDSAVVLSRDGSGYKLYARDIAEQQLTADLVTISACRSAGERAYAGEGLVGFAWAFLRAGARRVIAGLWDVDDRSTAQLMAQMYERMAHGESAGTALREVKRAMIAGGGTTAKPYYWAPFELFVGARVVP